MVYAKFGGQTECIMGNWKIENEGLLGNLIFRPSMYFTEEILVSLCY